MGRHTLAAAALGQVLAALIAGTAVASTSLARQVRSTSLNPPMRWIHQWHRRRRRCLLAATAATAATDTCCLITNCSFYSALQGVSAPTLQSGINYLLLGVVYTAVRLRAVGWKLKCR